MEAGHADQPAREEADAFAQHGQHRHHDDHGQQPGHDEILDRVDAHDVERLDFLRDFHRAQLGGDGGAGAADDDDRRDERPDLAQDGKRDEIGHQIGRAQLGELARALDGQHDAEKKIRQRDGRHRGDADVDHLVEQRRKTPAPLAEKRRKNGGEGPQG